MIDQDMPISFFLFDVYKRLFSIQKTHQYEENHFFYYRSLKTLQL